MNNSDHEFLSAIKHAFDERIPFNRVLGMRITSIEEGRPTIRFEMRDELVGNYLRGNLHGGVISGVMDATGGLTAFLGGKERMNQESIEVRKEQLGKLGTIDLRVDYLRPGLGKWFEATGHIIRAGNKIAVVRIELHNDEGEMIAVGTGAYIVA